MASAISLAVGRFGVPLKSRCSIKCEIPAAASVSYREPTPIKKLIHTAWVCKEANTYRLGMRHGGSDNTQSVIQGSLLIQHSAPLVSIRYIVAVLLTGCQFEGNLKE